MSNPTSQTLEEALDEQQQLLLRAVREENRALRESLALLDDYVDPTDAYRENGELWDVVGGGGVEETSGGFRQ